MAKSDLVPCFYKEQDASWERPAKLLPRSEVRELKAQKLGAFIFNGTAFRFSANALPDAPDSPLTSVKFWLLSFRNSGILALMGENLGRDLDKSPLPRIAGF
jgi:hypothetical protein